MKKSIIYLIFVIIFANLAFAQGIKDLRVCNVDNVCSGKESHQNCPQDCLPGSEDGYCDGFADGVCDEDCPSQADPDCEPKITFAQELFYKIFQRPLAELQGSREPMQRAYYLIIIGALITAISVIGAAVFLLIYLNK